MGGLRVSWIFMRWLYRMCRGLADVSSWVSQRTWTLSERTSTVLELHPSQFCFCRVLLTVDVTWYYHWSWDRAAVWCEAWWLLLVRLDWNYVWGGCLQLLEVIEILEVSWNLIDAPEKFNCQLEYDNMPITEPNLVASLNPRNCHLTIGLFRFIHNAVHNWKTYNTYIHT